jgi:hypothetical protein
MAILCAEHNLLFIMAPRTACTAIGQLLCQTLGGASVPQQDILNERGEIIVQRKHSTLGELTAHALITPQQRRELLAFVCVRNPFDSLVSLYSKKRSKYQPLLDDPDSWVYRLPHYAADMRYCATHSFTAWVVKSCARRVIRRALFGQHPSLYGRFTAGADCVMRFESLQRDFQQVLVRAGIRQHLEIPTLNRTTCRQHDYRAYYSPLSRSLVEFAYAADLHNYGYTFNGASSHVNPA